MIHTTTLKLITTIIILFKILNCAIVSQLIDFIHCTNFMLLSPSFLTFTLKNTQTTIFAKLILLRLNQFNFTYTHLKLVIFFSIKKIIKIQKNINNANDSLRFLKYILITLIATFTNLLKKFSLHYRFSIN